jgi:hypothetical protein
MTAQDFDDRDGHFTGILAQRLKPGEDPKSKLPALCEAFDVKTAEELVIRLAKALKIPGFIPEVPRRRKGRGRGRPDSVSLKLEAANVDAPDFLIERIKEKLIRRMEVIRAEERGRRKILDVAMRVVEEIKVDGDYNPLFVPGSTNEAKDERSKAATYLAQLYTHRKRRRGRSAEMKDPHDEIFCEAYNTVLPLVAEGRLQIRQLSRETRLTATGHIEHIFECTARRLILD